MRIKLLSGLVVGLLFLAVWANATPINYTLSGMINATSEYADSLETYVHLQDGDQFTGTITYDNEIGVTYLEFYIDNAESTYFQSRYMEQSPSPMVYLTNFNVSPLFNNAGVTDSNFLDFSWGENYLPGDLYGMSARGAVELCYGPPYGTSNIFFANFMFTVGDSIPVPEPATILIFLIGLVCFSEKIFLKKKATLAHK